MYVRKYRAQIKTLEKIQKVFLELDIPFAYVLAVQGGKCEVEGNSLLVEHIRKVSMIVKMI